MVEPKKNEMSKTDVLGDLARFELPADQGSAGGPSAGGLESMASLLLLLTRHGEGPTWQLFFVSALQRSAASDDAMWQ